MATSVPQDYSFLQKRRVRARVLSLSFVATMVFSLVIGPNWLYAIKLGPFDAPIIGIIGFLSFPLSVFFFAIAMVVANPTMGLASLIPILVFTPIIWVSGFFGSVFEFNNNRALSLMLAWASTEISAETQYLNH